MLARVFCSKLPNALTPGHNNHDGSSMPRRYLVRPTDGYCSLSTPTAAATPFPIGQSNDICSMPSCNNSFFKRGQMGRGFWETVLTLPRRAWGKSKVQDMTIEEKACAHFSDAVYAEPGQRSTEQCVHGGYILLQDEIPAEGDNPAIPLNGKRWAVYRAPDGVSHVLAFRGTADTEDLRHDLNLQRGLGEHEYMMDAAAWSMRVMTFLASQQRHARRRGEHDGGSNADTDGLKFSVTGHSLGGAVAMGVMLMLHDIPATAQQLEKDARVLRAGPDFLRFKRDVVDVWYAAVAARGPGEGAPPFELVGGHIFNPGAIPALPDGPRAHVASNVALGGAGAVAAGFAEASTWTAYIAEGSSPAVIDSAGYLTSLSAAEMSSMATASAATGVGVALGAGALAMYLFHRHRAGRAGSVDKRITTHHVLWDPLSCWFRLGKEKTYARRHRWNYHAISNFLCSERQEAHPVSERRSDLENEL